MHKCGGRNLGIWTQNWAQKNTQMPNLLNRIQGLQAPLHGCYVQRFVQNSRVTSYNPLDIKQAEQRTKTLNSILGVWTFRNNTSKFRAENQRLLPPQFSMKFSCGESHLPSVKSRAFTCTAIDKQHTSFACGETSLGKTQRSRLVAFKPVKVGLTYTGIITFL